MCEPVTLGAMSLALTATSAAAGVATSIGSYKRGVKAKELNDQSSKDAYILQTHLMNKQVQDARGVHSEKVGDNQIKSMQARAKSLNQAASGGVTGNSVQQVLDDFRRNEGVIENRLEGGLASFEEQSRYDMMGAQSNSQNRINAMAAPTLDGIYTSAVRGAGSTMTGLSEFKDLFDGDYDVE